MKKSKKKTSKSFAHEKKVLKNLPFLKELKKIKAEKEAVQYVRIFWTAKELFDGLAKKQRKILPKPNQEVTSNNIDSIIAWLEYQERIKLAMNESFTQQEEDDNLDWADLLTSSSDEIEICVNENYQEPKKKKRKVKDMFNKKYCE